LLVLKDRRRFERNRGSAHLCNWRALDLLFGEPLAELLQRAIALRDGGRTRTTLLEIDHESLELGAPNVADGAKSTRRGERRRAVGVTVICST